MTGVVSITLNFKDFDDAVAFMRGERPSYTSTGPVLAPETEEPSKPVKPGRGRGRPKGTPNKPKPKPEVSAVVDAPVEVTAAVRSVEDKISEFTTRLTADPTRAVRVLKANGLEKFSQGTEEQMDSVLAELAAPDAVLTAQDLV